MSSTAEQDTKEQGHTPHEANIIINGRSVIVTEKELTFDQVVGLSGLPTGPDISFTITYRKGKGNKPEGSMVHGGDPVKVKDGTVFNVDSTTRS